MSEETRPSLFKTIFSSPFRERWDRKIEYILSCVGYCVGFGNIWRFPYVVYKNGGSAFFFPYVIVITLLALPTFFLECLLGQFSGCNAISCYNFAPVCKGIGIAMTIALFFISIYYVIFLVYATKYIFVSFATDLPWTRCDPDWGANSNCLVRTPGDNVTLIPPCSTKKGNFTIGVDCHDRQSAAEQYWNKAILHNSLNKKYNVSNLGSIQWDLFFVLLITWVIIYIFVIRGIKSSGKITYFTAIFPIIILIVLLLFSLQLDGSTDGLVYLFYPQWTKITNIEVWNAAVIQAFYSSGVCMGCLTLYSSYNDFNHNLQRSVFIIIFMEIFASICTSSTVFCVLGFLADSLNVPIDYVVDAGPGLIFVSMPEAIAKMPFPQLWSVLYFLMLYSVGIDTQAVMVDTVVTNIYEEVAPLRKKQAAVRIAVCLVLFLLGIPQTFNGGIYVVDFIDFFSTNNTIIFLALCEIIAISYIYGLENFINDIEFMLNIELNVYWKICWRIFVPCVLCIFLITGLINALESACNEYFARICTLGWFLTIICILPVPVWAVYEFCKYSKTEATWKGGIKPTLQWGPRDVANKVAYLDWQRTQGVTLGPLTTRTLIELETEISPDLPDVKAVIENRIRSKKYSVLRRFSQVFRPEQIAQIESESKKK